MVSVLKMVAVVGGLAFALSCGGGVGGGVNSDSDVDGGAAVDGVCGAADGVAVASAPSADLCDAGDASSVAGAGPWTWTCDGTGGGASASCSAALATPPCKSPNATGPTADDSRWCDVDSLLAQALAAPASLPGYAFEIYTTDTNGAPVRHYSLSAGAEQAADGTQVTVDPTTPVKIASASKYLTAVTIFRALTLAAQSTSKSAASLLDTPISYLGCSGIDTTLAKATLSQVLHQVAGLSGDDNTCLDQTAMSLGDCACQILTEQYAYGPPGTSFVYGSASFTVASAMAEKVLGLAFNDQVHTLAAALGTDAQLVQPPLTHDLAGGFTASTRSYLPFLALAMPGPARGAANGVQLIDPALFDAMEEPFAATVNLVESPFMAAANLPVRYGVGSWVQCSQPWSTPDAWPSDLSSFDALLDYDACPKKVQHSEGKFGFLPWISFPQDASGAGHLGILGTRIQSSGDERVSFNSFLVFYMIEPIIGEILP